MNLLAPDILLAALLPPLVFWFFARRSDALRDVAVAFPVAVILWTAPYWIMGRTAAPVDFLSETVPWSSVRPAGYLNKNFLLNDTVLQFIPWTASARASWKSGELPFLDRASGAGSALWANPQAGVLSPLTLAAAVVPLIAWPVFLIACKLLLGLAGMYLFLRGENLSRSAATAGAAAFAFSVFSVAFILFPHTAVTLLLPLVLWQIRRVAAGGWDDVAVLSLLIALLFAGGHPESVFHGALLGVAYAFRVTWSTSRRRSASVTRLVVAGVIALAMAAPLILPFLAQLPHSQRLAELEAGGPGYFATATMSGDSLLPFLVPNYFGNPRVHNYRHETNFNDLAAQYAGLLTLALALFAIVRRLDHFWSAAFLVSTLVAIPPPFITPALARIPLLDISANGRLRFVVVLAMAVLAAKGLDHLIAAGSTTLRVIAVGLFAVTTVVCVASYPLFAQYGIRRLIFFTTLPALLSLAIAAAAASAGSRRFAAGAWVLIAVDLFAVVGLYNPAVERRFFYPETAAIARMKAASPATRVLGVERALMTSSSAVVGLEDVRSHDPMAFRPYVALLERNGYDQSTYFGQFKSLPPQPLLDFLGVRYILSQYPLSSANLEVVHVGGDGYVHENRSALARFFVPDAWVASGARRTDTPGQTVAVASSIDLDERARVELVRYERNGSVIRVTSPAPSFVASSEVALPGWFLERNGSEWPLELVNGIFMGWRVPAGQSTFMLRYRPPLFRLGLAAGGAGAAAAILLFIFGRRRRQSAEPEGAAAVSANMTEHHGVVS